MVDLDVNKVWVCCLGQGSVAAQDVVTVLTRQLTRCGYQNMVWHGSYEDPAAAGAALLQQEQQSSMARAKPKTQAKPKAKPRSKAKAKPKTKAKTKAKPQPVSKAKAKPNTKTKAKAKPKPVSKALQKVWKHCQGAKPVSKAKMHK
jgi:hypothetical protein